MKIIVATDWTLVVVQWSAHWIGDRQDGGVVGSSPSEVDPSSFEVTNVQSVATIIFNFDWTDTMKI